MISTINAVYKKILFIRNFKRKNDFFYIRKLLMQNKGRTEIACFTYYKLGMYFSVLDCKYAGKGWYGNFANAVAFAAVGNAEKSLNSVKILCEELRIPNILRVKLAKDLAGYLPHTSLALIADDNTLEAKQLRLALLVFLREKTKAKQILCDFHKGNKVIDLYKINLLESNTEKLQQLNSFFSNSGMQVIELIDKSKALSPSNIHILDILPTIKDGPLVSILMTTYCSEKYVEMAITSLLNQTYRNIEVIIIDDASTDETLSIINSIAERDNRVRYIKMSENVGTFIAKNEGLIHANGEFITCHDSDDWAHPSKIEMQVQPLISNDRLVCTTSQWIRMDQQGDLYSRKVYPLARLNPASPLFRRSIIEDIGSWDPVRTGADSEFFSRIQRIIGVSKILNVKKVCTIGSHREGSLMTDLDTGYKFGISKERLRYWESWNLEQIN